MSYINIISFFLLFIYLFLEIESFIPLGRLAHSSALIENKLYFFGGSLRLGCSNEVFYLDISQPFNIASPSWTANEGMGMPIKSCWGTVSFSDINNEQNIYLFSGITQDINTNNDSFISFAYKLTLRSGQWEIPTIKGNVPERRRDMRAVNDNSGKIYIFGGNNFNLAPAPTKHFNDMAIFNVVESSWLISSPLNAPPQRSAYSATLLSNGVIVYIGGFEFVGGAIQYVDMSRINLYDTKSLLWSVQSANLTVQIGSRRGHTAVLAQNGKIIIYGGARGNNYALATPEIAVLNTESNSFEWTIPLVSSNIGAVPSLIHHTANLVENYMIVAFGNNTQLGYPASMSANIYIMDIRTYTWVNTFVPENIVKPTPSSTPVSPTTSANPTNTSGNQTDVNKQLTTMKVIIGTISGILGAVVLIVIGFFGYKRYHKHHIMRIHGNN